MANAVGVFLEAFGRLPTLADDAVAELSAQALATRPSGVGNSIAWLVWHLARVQDDHVADASGAGQVWIDEDWSTRFALPLDDTDTGYGHTGGQVATVRADADLLSGYLHAVVDRTLGWLGDLTDEDLDRVVDDAYDPPVTLAARLSSVLGDDLQHLGQAAYARGLLSG
jgi:uncharacterized damage-inducible protein DinB